MSKYYVKKADRLDEIECAFLCGQIVQAAREVVALNGGKDIKLVPDRAELVREGADLPPIWKKDFCAAVNGKNWEVAAEIIDMWTAERAEYKREHEKEGGENNG